MSTKRLGACAFVAVGSIFAAVFGILATSADQENVNVYSYLPENACIGRINALARTSSGEQGTKEAILRADLDNDGIAEVVVFYSVRSKDYDGNSTGVLILKKKNNLYQKVLDHTQYSAGYINPLSGVWDINGDGRLEIVAARWVGASFGGYFDVFQWKQSEFVSLNGEWNTRADIAEVKLEDVDQDGVVEVIIHHRFSYPDTYKWETGKYVLQEEGGFYPAYR